VAEDRLADVVAEGTRRALAAILNPAGEHLVGFALCTDDDLRSLSAVGCTREFLAGHDPTWLFHPTEWPDDAGDCLGEAGRILWTRADACDQVTSGQHVERSFACLVAALKRLRSDAAVDDDVFLVALSTDAGERLTALEDAAVRELNPAEFHSRWRRAVLD
jgi:hypothetical protein